MTAGDDTAVPPADRDGGEAPRCGFIALIGAPNAGKSTLVNALVGAKVSIVTHKVQTTRALVRGIAIEGSAQLVLIDTPGIFAPKRRLDRAMVATAWGARRMPISSASSSMPGVAAMRRRTRSSPRWPTCGDVRC